MHIKVIVAIILASLITSCGTTKLSSIDIAEFNAGKKAIVRTYNQPLLAGMILGQEPVTKIISVDGKKIDIRPFKLDEQITVDVGLHRIEFSCSDPSGYNEKDFSEIIQLETKPYHEYLVRCSFDSAFGINGTYDSRFSVEEKHLK